MPTKTDMPPLPTLPDAQALLESIRRPSFKPAPPEALARVCRRYGLSLLVLFGSHVKGRVHPNSDVDIAVLPEKRRRPNLLSLYVDLVPALGSDRLDIVDLRRAPPLLAWNVAREGVLLYAADAWEWTTYRIQAMKNWDDVRRFRRAWLREAEVFLEELGVRA
jgi:predicted nucleotidyltransferase